MAGRIILMPELPYDTECWDRPDSSEDRHDKRASECPWKVDMFTEFLLFMSIFNKFAMCIS